ncbi:MAG: chitobiase/beta-hexosaminidase C-terminal domain-containing protein [Bacteroidales bacterium]|nr:chitobiase/beta-hexosaminidase C-terminal domain-containing protein [Bacteroidales bacterium]
MAEVIFRVVNHVSLSANDPLDTIYYTLDGSIPGQKNPLYPSIEIQK